jgi:tRNA threonylcarbamoyladenosine biosynthesis protein TsaB
LNHHELALKRPPMRILGIDISTRTGSVAIVENETVLAEVSTTGELTHGKRLLSTIDSTLEMAGLGVDRCNGFAVTTGPGSFTGLRIGISTIKGLAFATGKPVSGVSSLDVLASQFPLCRHLVCPFLDARKGQVYTALYQCGEDLMQKKLVADCAVDPQEWLRQIDQPCLFAGDGLTVHGDLVRKALGERAHFAPPHLSAVRASAVAVAGMAKIAAGGGIDAAGLKPYYIRKSDAELKTRNRSKLLTS